MAKNTVAERLIRIEVKLDNHIHTHDVVLKWIFCPVLVGTVLTFIKIYFFK